MSPLGASPEPEGLTVDNTHPALGAFWHPVATVEEVDDAERIEGRPLGVVLLGRHWAVARLGPGGALAALPDRCPHRYAPLSAGTIEPASGAEGAGRSLRCAYHGYRFDAEGTCVEVPAQDPSLPIPARASCGHAAAVAERYGLVWLAPEEPRWPLPVIPELEEGGWTTHVLDSTWRAGAAQMVDNFLDVAHFPFTHRGSFGDADDRVVQDYDVARDGWTFTARHVHQARHMDADGAYTASSERVQEYTFTPPHFIHLALTHPDEGTRMSMAFVMQPIDAERTRLWVIDLHRELLERGVDPEQLRAARLQVATEDRDLLERFPHSWLPLDLPAEVHSKADRITVELRRVLREIVEQGTAA